MKYYIIAGEASGDLHASNLMKEIKKLDAQAEFRCWGGDRMAEQGGGLVMHYRDTAWMGFWEVLVNLRKILRYLSLCKKDIASYRPDALILVDYPGFNLRIAAFAHKSGLPVHYYISPQVWAWKASRVKQIRRTVDRMYVILPFEKDFYAQRGYGVEFVGHPLLDAIRDANPEQPAVEDDARPVVALLPGSRRQEIARMLPVMLSVQDEFPGHRFVVAAAPSVPPEFYKEIAGRRAFSVEGDTYSLLRRATTALVTSGTATLETALWNVPQVVCYKGSAFSYLIARLLVKVKYISLVNLVMDKPVVTELIQGKLHRKALAAELSRLLEEETRRKVRAGYAELAKKLGGPGASARTAELIVRGE